MSEYNFGGSGSNLTKLYQGRWLQAWVIKWTLILQGVPPTKFGRAKMSKIRRHFWQLSTLIANVSETHRLVEKLNSTWSTTFHPLMGDKNGWTLVHWPKSYRHSCWHIQLYFFREILIRPLGGATPSNFYTPNNSLKCISSRTWGTGRSHVGLCPIFLNSFCFTRFF